MPRIKSDPTQTKQYAFRAQTALVDAAKRKARGNLSGMIRQLLAEAVGRPDLAEMIEPGFPDPEAAGRKGGATAAANMTAEQRLERARKAVDGKRKS